MGKRIFYLDNLRSAMIILAVLYNAASGFMIFLPTHVYVIESERNIGFDMFALWAESLILPILFFISGYFGASSLRVRLFNPFFKEKWHRIGLPWLFGCLFLTPELAYLAALQTTPDMNFITFYTEHFWQECFQQGPFWFLSLLLLFFIFLMAAKKLRPHILQRNAAAALSPAIVILIISIDIAASYGLHYVFGNHWIHIAYLLNFQPIHLADCGLYFILGIYAFKHRWFTLQGYVPSLHWLIPFTIATLFYVLCFYPRTAVFLPFLFFHTLPAIESILSMTGLLACIAAFASWGNQNNKLTLTAASLSYPVYFLSQTLLQNMAWFIRPLTLPSCLKFIFLCSLVLVYAYMLAKYALIHLRCFNTKHYFQ